MLISSSLFLAFAAFAFVTTITPGPNNIMLLTSGANFGFRRTLPHLMGVTFGFSFMVFLVGVGLGAVFDKFPFLYTVLCYVSLAYLLYLAWKIVKSGPITEDVTAKQPMSFMSAALFQWVNPKAWIMAIAAISTYVPEDNFFINVMVISALFIIFFLPCGVLWTACGTYLRRFLNQPKHLLIFNITMAILLLLSLYPLILDIVK